MAITVRELRPANLLAGPKDVGPDLARALSALSPTVHDGKAWRRTLRIKKFALQTVFLAFEYGKVVGTATLAVDPKFSRGCGLAARIEDVAVEPESQGLGVGKALVRAAVKKARSLGAYKVTLECKEELAPFYALSGFKKNGVSMRLDP